MLLLSIGALLAQVEAITLYPDDRTSILNALDTVIQGTLTYCPWFKNTSGATPGMFQPPYYWWEAGVVWGSLIDYSAYSGNHTLDSWVREALVFQSGSNWDFMTENQTSVEGNDDQAFWGIAAMNAAEKNFTSPGGKYPPWLYFAQGTFNTMANRWSTTDCQGGLRWQIYSWNAGYDYKNMVSNGCLFHLASRLARFTNNVTYVEWAERVWDWAMDIGFMHPINPSAADPVDVQIQVFDGAHTTKNCSDLTTAEWSYDQGLLISGTAYLYNYTGDQKWLDRSKMLWGRAKQLFGSDGSGFFPDKSIAYEASCQAVDSSRITCSNDMRCFKGIFLSMLGLATQVAPELKDLMWTNIKASSQAAAWSCSGGYDGVTCGLSWLKQGWDNYFGLGEQSCALQAFNTLLAMNYRGPLKASDLPGIYTPRENTENGTTNSTAAGGGPTYGWGGEAGLNNSDVQAYSLSLNTGDVAGAGVLTTFVIIFIVSGSIWLVI